MIISCQPAGNNRYYYHSNYFPSRWCNRNFRYFHYYDLPAIVTWCQYISTYSSAIYKCVCACVQVHMYTHLEPYWAFGGVLLSGDSFSDVEGLSDIHAYTHIYVHNMHLYIHICQHLYTYRQIPIYIQMLYAYSQILVYKCSWILHIDPIYTHTHAHMLFYTRRRFMPLQVSRTDDA